MLLRCTLAGRTARTHITHSIPFSMHVKHFAMKQTVTLRFNRFIKVTNETNWAWLSVHDLLWVRQTRFYKRALLPRLLPTQIGPKMFSCLLSCRVFMHRATTIECNFPPLIAVHLHGDKSINKLPFPMSHCWLSRKFKKKHKKSRNNNEEIIWQHTANWRKFRATPL